MNREKPSEKIKRDLELMESGLLEKNETVLSWSEGMIEKKIQQLVNQRKELYGDLKSILSLESDYIPEEKKSPFDIAEFKRITEELHKIRMEIRKGQEILKKLQEERVASAKEIYKKIHPQKKETSIDPIEEKLAA